MTTPTKSEGELQRDFTLAVSRLIAWAYSKNMELTFGEAYRTPEQAALNAKSGAGIANSLHCKRLAIDLNLFVNGEFKTATEDYLALGEYWESLDPLARWGGRFTTRPDADHFSFTYEGAE